MSAETVREGKILAIENENRFLFLTRDEAVELMEKLPQLINEMPVKIAE